MVMVNGLQPTKRDIRDFSYSQQFGSVSPLVLPKEFYVSQPLDIKQQYGSDFCIGFASAAVREFTEGVILDPFFVWSQMAKLRGDWREWGMDLRTAAKVLTKIGIVEQKDQPYNLENKDRDFLANWENYPKELENKASDHKAISYFWIDGPYDFFDNIRSTLYLNKEEKRSVLVGAEWRPSWSSAIKGIVKTTDFSEMFFGHAFIFFGWKEIDNEPYLVAQLSNGKEFGDSGIFYFSRSVVNSNAFRFSGLTFKDFNQEDYKKTQFTLIQRLYDLIKIYQQLIKMKLGKVWG